MMLFRKTVAGLVAYFWERQAPAWHHYHYCRTGARRSRQQLLQSHLRCGIHQHASQVIRTHIAITFIRIKYLLNEKFYNFF